MSDRNQLLKQRFVERVQAGDLPVSPYSCPPETVGLNQAQLLDLFETQVMSRHLDLQSREMQKQGQSFYTIGSSGHEGNAVVGLASRVTDMAFLHYRSGALMLQRAKQVPGQTPLYDMLLSFAASAEDPISGGRHKVLGSKSLYIPPQTSTIASHLPKAMGTAYSIPLADSLDTDAILPSDSVVICNFGDASANHSTAQGAINAAAWGAYQSAPLPIVFICEDNGIGISTSTPNGWIKANFSQRPGLHYLFCDGLDLCSAYGGIQQALHIARTKRQPVFLHMRTVRLLGHAGSDAEFVYRDEADIAATEGQDPLLYSARLLLDSGVSKAQVLAIYQDTASRIEAISRKAVQRPRLQGAEHIMQSIIPPALQKAAQPLVEAEQRQTLFAHERHNLDKPQHLAKLINWTLMDLLAEHGNIVMCGEDIGRKGGVYNVTAKLVHKFGKNRVINTLLDEQSILGLAIGLAHNGFLPIPEIQFLAYVHNAEDQIRGEAATLPFFSNGQYSNPMVIRIAGLAYQKGFGGHFHNDNSIAVFRDIPGVIIACPSNGADAVAMLRESVRLAQEEQRVVVFIEPIALYMKKDLHQEGDGLWCFPYLPPAENQPVTLGDIGQHGEGQSLAIVSYGNGYYLSRQAAELLQAQGIECRVIDLRWLAPLPEAALLQAIAPCEHILVVDECRRTGSASEAIMTWILEQQSQLQAPMSAIKRITAEDCFIPLGSASYDVLPSCQGIVESAVQLLEGEPS